MFKSDLWGSLMAHGGPRGLFFRRFLVFFGHKMGGKKKSKKKLENFFDFFLIYPPDLLFNEKKHNNILEFFQPFFYGVS